MLLKNLFTISLWGNIKLIVNFSRKKLCKKILSLNCPLDQEKNFIFVLKNTEHKLLREQCVKQNKREEMKQKKKNHNLKHAKFTFAIPLPT